MLKIKQVRHALRIWILKNKFIAINLFISLIFLAIMLSYSSKQTFWYDEIDTLGKAMPEFPFLVNETIALKSGFSFPFFALAWLWYRIAPYGESYLLIITEIPIFIAVFVLGLCGRRLSGRGQICGILACLFGATSAIFIFRCGLEFRSYSCAVLLSAFTLFFYIGCQKALLKGGAVKKSDWIGYSISLMAMVYFHYIAVLVPAGFFMADLFLFIRKKIKLIFLRPYILAALLFLPWAVRVFIFAEKDLSKYTLPPPRTIDIFHLFNSLLDVSNMKQSLFAFAIAAILVYFFIKIVKKNPINWRYSVLMSMLWTVVFMIAASFIYSHTINTAGSFWVDRYFFVLLPEIFLISAFGTFLLINHLAQKNNAAKRIMLIFLAIILFFNVLFIAAKYEDPAPYYAIAEKLAATEDIYAQETAVAKQHDETGNQIFHAWNEYYVSKQGQRQKFHMAQRDKIREGAYKKIYFFSGLTPGRREKDLFSKYNLVSIDNKLQIMTYERKD